MGKCDNLILTGWGYVEYVVSAAVALKALDGRAEVCGVSRRRLPEFLGELAGERGTPQWKRIYLLGLSLSGDPESLKAALVKLKAKGVEVTWISAIEMPEQVSEVLEGVLEDRSRGARGPASTLLEEVGKVFGADVEALMPFTRPAGSRVPRDRAADVRAYFTLIDTAQFYHRNYQDESLYATTAR